MPPPAGNALETSRLLALESSASFGRTADVRGGAEDDGAWELQRRLLLAEYGEEERDVSHLLVKLVAVRRKVLFTLLQDSHC